MGCSACGQARQKVAENFNSGNALGTIKAISAGAVMVAEKLAGVDINKKYGVPDQHSSRGKPYTRD